MFQPYAPEESLFLRDGVRRIDMILTYKEEDDHVVNKEHQRYRDIFLKNLTKKGLEIETDQHVNIHLFKDG